MWPSRRSWKQLVPWPFVRSDEGMEQCAVRLSTLDLCSHLEHLLESAYLPEEAEYRIRKLINRTSPVAGKMFLKTVKGQELIRECMRMTCEVEELLVSGRPDLYRGLTRLEDSCDELLRKTSEFRVKAG